jgi:hypothetical protein
VKRFRGELAFEDHRLSYHSTLGSRLIKEKKLASRICRQEEEEEEKEKELFAGV